MEHGEDCQDHGRKEGGMVHIDGNERTLGIESELPVL